MNSRVRADLVFFSLFFIVRIGKIHGLLFKPTDSIRRHVHVATPETRSTDCLIFPERCAALSLSRSDIQLNQKGKKKKILKRENSFWVFNVFFFSFFFRLIFAIILGVCKG